jgi:hypothetical protein
MRVKVGCVMWAGRSEEARLGSSSFKHVIVNIEQQQNRESTKRLSSTNFASFEIVKSNHPSSEKIPHDPCQFIILLPKCMYEFSVRRHF